MTERWARAVEVLCVLCIAIGAGLAYLPAGFIVGGALMLLGAQGVTARRDGA